MRVRIAIGPFASFVLSAAAAIVLIAGVTIESFNPARRAAVLIFLILLHLIRCHRLVLPREFTIYCVFVGYMCIALIWTRDVTLAMNTMLPAVDFALIVVLFATLATCHNLNAVLAGTLAGFLVGAVAYTLTQGFPFSYPKDFSYNTIAGMYLFGLFITVMLGWSIGSRLLVFTLGLPILVLIAATTSIKTNLGILLGVATAGLVYFRGFMRVLRRNAMPFVVVAAFLVYAVASNESLIERLQGGFDRVSLGLQILSSRDDEDSGGTSFSERQYWQAEGLRGWARNPLFGYGVEEFRADYGITSHSTPIDLLYNTGIIGCSLFYGVLLSIALRLLHASRRSAGLRIVLLATFVCYLFITISGTMHYDSFLAVFVAISAAVLRVRTAPRALQAPPVHAVASAN